MSRLAAWALVGTLALEVAAQRQSPTGFPTPGVRAGGGRVSVLPDQGRLGAGAGPFQRPALGAPEVSLPQISPIPPLGTPEARLFPRRILGFRRAMPFFPFFLPWAPQLVIPYAYPAPATVVVVHPPPEPQPPAPAEPAKAVIHEYKPAEPRPPEGKEAVFAIVLADGTVDSALVVWVQAGSLNWIDASHRRRSVSLESVDRERTLRLNRERALRLPLPGW